MRIFTSKNIFAIFNTLKEVKSVTILFLVNVYNLYCCVNVYAFICIDIPVTNQFSKDATLENKINFAIFLRFFPFFFSFFLNSW